MALCGEYQTRAVRQARALFVAMVVAYALGVFNDNYFKQVAILKAQYGGMGWLKGLALGLFALPYLLFSAYAGWLADRFPKRNVIIGTKIWELGAMITGAVGVLTGSWVLMIGMVFMMGFQSAVFGPSLNGSIPELYPACYVTRANAILKVFTTVAILLGMVAGGWCLSVEGTLFGQPLKHVVVASVAVTVSVVGVVASFGVPRRPGADPTARIPWAGPVDTVRHLIELRSDPILARTLLADVFVWSVGALQLIIIPAVGQRQFGLGEGAASNLMFALLVGIAVGGALAPKLARGANWHRVLVPSALAMALLAFAAPAVMLLPHTAALYTMAALLLLLGAAGGLFMIPCESFIQVRPKAEKKGTVIAAANFGIFSGIVLAGGLSMCFDEMLTPTTFLALTGLVSLPVALWLRATFRKEVATP